MSTERQVLRALGSISTATLASRVLGFVRDMVVARAFGAGLVTDAFFVAYRVPNLLRRLLAEGALSTAVIPVFVDYLVNRPRRDTLRLLRALLGVALVALGLATLLGMMGAEAILLVIAPGFTADPGQSALAAFLTRVMFPYLPLVGLAALATGVLNAEGRFFVAALGPAVLNVGMIACVVLLAARLDPPILSLAVGVLVGGLGQLLVQVPDLIRCGLLVAPSAELRHPALGRVGRLLLPAAFGLAAVQVTIFVNTLLASFLPRGSISFLYYADRVMEFPLGIFGIALASAALPTMSRQAAAGDRPGLAGTLGFSLRLSCFVSIPATVALFLLGAPIVHVLFERGEFRPGDTVATAGALAAYVVGLPAFSGSRIAAQVFYAMGEPATAVKMGVVSVVANVLAAVTLMAPLQHTGLALASSIAAYVNVGALVWVARQRLGPLGGRAALASIGRTVASSLPLAAWCGLSRWAWPDRASTLVGAAWLATTVAGGLAVFWIASGALARAERSTLLGILPLKGRG